MNNNLPGFNAILQQTLRFEYQYSGISRLNGSHSTGWRTFPSLMISHVQQGGECIKLEDGRSFNAEKGELIILPPGIHHKVDVTTATEIRIWTHVNYYIFDSINLLSMMDVPILVGKSVGTKIGAVIEDWVMMGKRPAIQNRNHGQIIEERIKTDDVLNMENPVAISSKMNVYGFSILELLSPLCFMKQSAFEKIDKLKNLGPVLEYMRRNFDKPLDRDELARIACLSPAQFHVVFKDTVGVTPIRFLMGIRFRHAQHLLLRTSLTVLEVAARCGYDDVFVFSKFFKRLCKISPRDYRIAGSRT